MYRSLLSRQKTAGEQKMLFLFSVFARSKPGPTLNLLGVFAYFKSLKDEELIRGNWACFGFQVNEFSLAECVSLMQKGNTVRMSRSELKC